MLGVRLPQLRSIAKKCVRDTDWKMLVNGRLPDDSYFEEIMLRGMIIGYGTEKENDICEAFKLFDEFVPLVDNWSVCDSCISTFTVFGRYHSETWEHIKPLLYSQKEFEVRTGLIVLLSHFLRIPFETENAEFKKIPRKRQVTMDMLNDNKNGMYTTQILDCLNRLFNQGYYAQMAAAWLLAECFVTFPGAAYTFLQKNNMDKVTYNKALSKICESRIPTREVKQHIKTMKI